MRRVPFIVASMLAASAVTACSQDSSHPATSEAAATPPPSPTVIDKPVAWPTTAVDETTLAALPESARAAVSSSQVPVLLVARASLLDDTVVIAKERFTAVSTKGDGIHVSVSATRSAHRRSHLPKVEGKHQVRGQPAWVTQNEAIWSASWIENGIAYVLELECASLPDPRCDDDAHLQTLIDELVYVGGRGAR